MRVTKLNSDKLVFVKASDYSINWDKAPSKGQQIVQNFLRPFWKSHIVLAEMRIPGSLLRCDIVNVTNKIIIEFSGVQHTKFIPFLHGNSRLNYLKQLKSDCKKEEWAIRNNFRFIELFDSDLKENINKEFFEKQGIYL